MASSKRSPILPMVPHLSPSVHLYRMKVSCMISKSRTKQYCPFRTSLDISALTSPPFQGTFWYHSHFRNQYCDGLRGALIIYDPNDPHKSLYDIDNGERDISRDPGILTETSLETIRLSHLLTGTTIFLRMPPKSRKLINWSEGLPVMTCTDRSPQP
jgi:hypothetical protein